MIKNSKTQLSIMIQCKYLINKGGFKCLVIEVKDTSLALGDISKYYKEKFDIPFIGVTGSVGKTTTRDMI
ncbi:hypothetical protein ACTPEM_24245, partial [Clostridioides difficile]